MSVASVVVASGFFVLVGQPSSVRADVVNPRPQVKSYLKRHRERKRVISVKNQETPFSLERNLRALLEIRFHLTHLQKAELSDRTNSSLVWIHFLKDEEAQKNPES